LEVVEIIYKQKEVKKSMFFDTKEDLLVTTNFTQIAKSIINEATQLQRLDLCFDDYIKAANIGSDPYLAYENVFKNNAFMTFKDLLELLKEYSFFKDLRTFFGYLLKSAYITGKLFFRTDKSNKKISKEDDLSNLMLKKEIEVYSIAYFNFFKFLITGKCF
jgi:hypothetical protein